jgi:CHAD domain-containing protein
MFRAKAVERYLEPLRVAQEALGAFNDLTVADVAFRTQVHADARAWFAVGWLAARRATCLQDCAHALGRLTQADRFWKP